MTLSCPDGGNYAAIAKQLHETAVQAEERIFELEQELRSAVNRPTIVQIFTAPQTGYIANFEANFGSSVGPFTYAFNNIPGDCTVDNDDTAYIQLGEGVYEIGVAATAVPAGAVNDNSIRIWQIKHYRPDPSSVDIVLSGFSFVDRTGMTKVEANSVIGVKVAMAGTFRIRPGDRILFTLLHTNVASTINISDISCYMSKVSDASLTEVL